MERNTNLVGRGSGITHSFEQSRLLCRTAGALGLTIAEPPCVLPSTRNRKREGALPVRRSLIRLAWSFGEAAKSDPRAPGTGL